MMKGEKENANAFFPFRFTYDLQLIKISVLRFQLARFQEVKKYVFGIFGELKIRGYEKEIYLFERDQEQSYCFLLRNNPDYWWLLFD